MYTDAFTFLCIFKILKALRCLTQNDFHLSLQNEYFLISVKMNFSELIMKINENDSFSF